MRPALKTNVLKNARKSRMRPKIRPMSCNTWSTSRTTVLLPKRIANELQKMSTPSKTSCKTSTREYLGLVMLTML